MKYIIIKLDLQGGQLGYFVHSLHQIDAAADMPTYADEYVEFLYKHLTRDNKNTEEDYETGNYVDDPEEIILQVSVHSVKEITEEEHNVLKRYL